MSDPRILNPEKIREMEEKYKITLAEAVQIIKDMDPDSHERFDPMEREAILFVGTAGKMGYITVEYMQEIFGTTPPH